jgi:diguanylate cyclase (GGDEF)-like protein
MENNNPSPASPPESPDVVFLRRLLGTLALRAGGKKWFDEAWSLALALYGEHPMAPGLEEARVSDGPTVLVVDDSPMTRMLLHRLLAREFQVLQAEDGARALVLALEGRPDLILLDVVMPVMDGFTAYGELRKDPRTRDIPIVFLTALQDEEEELRALEAGATDFIRKPFHPGHVLARIRNHLGQKLSRDRLRDQAGRDGLTGLGNRGRFNTALEQEWQRCRREGKPLSLILGDVDSFKNYNDAYGHPAGDACLKAVAGAFREAVRRPADLAARYGGEEFACLLPDTDAEGAQATADRITLAMAALAIPHAHSLAGPCVTVSLGLATIRPAEGDSPESLLEDADRHLYVNKRLAKARGRAAGGDRA